MAEPLSSWFCAADYPVSDTLENPIAVSKALEKSDVTDTRLCLVYRPLSSLYGLFFRASEG